MEARRQTKDDFYIFGSDNWVEQSKVEQVWRGWISAARLLVNEVIIVATLWGCREEKIGNA